MCKEALHSQPKECLDHCIHEWDIWERKPDTSFGTLIGTKS